MSITGKELIDLPLRHGWELRHGLTRQFPGEQRPRRTVIPDKNRTLGRKTLGNILGPNQTDIGSAGLRDMLGE